MLPGTSINKKKDGTTYFRSSITLSGKHVSLGSFSNETEAHQAYLEAKTILTSSLPYYEHIASNSDTTTLPFAKKVMLLNFRDNKIYIKNPIYLLKSYFLYYLSAKTVLKFDIDDLFFYSNHKIQKRGGYLFVSDYGMQINILSRYGIKNYAKKDIDFCFLNNDPTDFRYRNIKIINQYYGVSSIKKGTATLYIASIHINGNYKIGTYKTETEAAIAYNKTVDLLKEKGCTKEYITNYIVDLSAVEYASYYNKITISDSIRNLVF